MRFQVATEGSLETLVDGAWGSFGGDWFKMENYVREFCRVFCRGVLWGVL